MKEQHGKGEKMKKDKIISIGEVRMATTPRPPVEVPIKGCDQRFTEEGLTATHPDYWTCGGYRLCSSCEEKNE